MAEVESQMPLEDAEMAGYHDKSRANALSVFENATTLKKHESYEEFCSKFQVLDLDFSYMYIISL